MLTSLFLLKYREKNEDNFSEEKKYFFIFTKILIAFIFALGLFLQLKQEIKTIVADHYFYQIKSELNKNNYFTAYLLYDWLIELEVRHYYYNLNFGGALARLLNNEIDETWSRGAQQLILPRIVGEIDRDNYNSFCARALIYTAMASQDKKDIFVKAKKEFDACIDRSPGLPRNYFELAKFYFKQGENDKAKETLSIFLSKLPELDDERLNEEHKFTIKYEIFLAYSLWGDIYLAEENYDQARKLYEYGQNLIDRDKEFVFINRKIADSFYREGESEKAIMILKENINVEGSNYFWYFLIAKIYSELDENLQALEYANQALELDSDNQEIKSLIFSLSK
jgi:tetratricopeptide (TPR) repeat protein